MPYILIVIITTGLGSRTAVSSMRFEDKLACSQAKETIEKNSIIAYCFPIATENKMGNFIPGGKQ